MSVERPEDFYQVTEMSPAECFELAREYQRAAEQLKVIWRPGKAATRAPFRFTAIHSIELYLTAYLLQAGEPWSAVRSMGHNLQQRYQRAAAKQLVLKKRTIASLEAISDQREYVKSRYMAKDASLLELNNLDSVLSRVAEKVSSVFEPHK